MNKNSDSKKFKIKVQRVQQPTETSKHSFQRSRVTSPDRKGLWGLFKFIMGVDKKKTF